MELKTRGEAFINIGPPTRTSPSKNGSINEPKRTIPSSKLKTTQQIEEAIEHLQTRIKGIMERAETYKKIKNIEVFSSVIRHAYKARQRQKGNTRDCYTQERRRN